MQEPAPYAYGEQHAQPLQTLLEALLTRFIPWQPE
jgi:hypothetical protein